MPSIHTIEEWCMPFNKEIFLIAARNGEIAVLDTQLQEKDAKIDASDDYGQTALFFAAACGQRKAVEFLISRGADLSLEQSSSPQNTPLLIALRNGHPEIVGLLLTQAGDIGIDRKDVNDDTALHLALKKGYNDLAQTMIEKGANPFIENKAKQIPADHPVLKNYLKHRFCPSIFVKAAGCGDLTTLRVEAAKLGFNINAYAKVSKYYETALTVAAYKGQVDTVSFLLKQPGIDLYAPSWDENGSNFTASALAAYRNRQEVLRLLIAAGISEDEQYQALKQSVKFSSLETARYLIDEVGLNVNHIYKSGNEMIPLILWLFDERSPSKDLLQFLLERGVKDKGLVVRRVADFQDKEYLEIVLEHVANVDDAAPETGNTALMIAAQAGNFINVFCLLAHGANPFLKNKKDETALDLANPGDYQVFKEKRKKYGPFDICKQFQARLDIQEALLQASLKRKKSWRNWQITGAVVTGLIGALCAGFAAMNYFGLSAWLGSTAAGFIAALSMPLWINFALLGVGAVLVAMTMGFGIAALVNKISSRKLQGQLAPIETFNQELFLDALTFQSSDKGLMLSRREILYKQLGYAKQRVGKWHCRDIQEGSYRLSPIIYAVRMGDAATVAGLLDAGAYIESHDGLLNTTLVCAINGKHKEVVGLLLQRGAMIDTNIEKLAASSSKEIKDLLQAEKQKRASQADIIDASAYQFGFQQPTAKDVGDKQPLLANNRLQAS